MILNEFLKSQKLIFENFKNSDKCIWDIVIYGSMIRGKENPEDVDAAVIISEKKSFAFKLELAQKLRQSLKFQNFKFDVKVVDFNDFQDSNFLARQGIILEGFSITQGKFLSEIFGFKQYCIFKYGIQNLSLTKKRVFSYALSGRYGEEGLKNSKKIEQLGRGVLKVPIQHSEEIESLLQSYNIDYKMEYCLVPFF